MFQPRSNLIAMVAAAFTAACGGSDSPSGPGGNGGGGGTTREIKANPSFATDIQEIFTRNGCTASG